MAKLAINISDWMNAAVRGDLEQLSRWEKSGALGVRYDPVRVGVSGGQGRPKIFEVTDTQKENALHKALRSHQVDYAKKLLSLGSFPATESTDGYTPLHVACMNDFPEIAKILISAGHPLHQVYRKAKPLLMGAIKAKAQGCIEVLLDAMPDAATKPEHQEAVHEAVRTNKPQIVQMLLTRGFDPNAPDNDRFASTPLQRAALSWGHDDLQDPQSPTCQIIRLLIEAGANDAVGIEGESNCVQDLFRPKAGADWLNGLIAQVKAERLEAATIAPARRQAASRL